MRGERLHEMVHHIWCWCGCRAELLRAAHLRLALGCSLRDTVSSVLRMNASFRVYRFNISSSLSFKIDL